MYAAKPPALPASGLPMCFYIFPLGLVRGIRNGGGEGGGFWLDLVGSCGVLFYPPPPPHHVIYYITTSYEAFRRHFPIFPAMPLSLRLKALLPMDRSASGGVAVLW
jgi:hypothetical protein